MGLLTEETGQRFKVSCFSERDGCRVVYGCGPKWLVASINLHPICRDPQVKDRAGKWSLQGRF